MAAKTSPDQKKTPITVAAAALLTNHLQARGSIDLAELKAEITAIYEQEGSLRRTASIVAEVLQLRKPVSFVTIRNVVMGAKTRRYERRPAPDRRLTETNGVQQSLTKIDSTERDLTEIKAAEGSFTELNTPAVPTALASKVPRPGVERPLHPTLLALRIKANDPERQRLFETTISEPKSAHAK